MTKYAIIAAAGSGSRMGGPVPKQFMMLSDRPVLWYSVEAFLAAFEDLTIIVVLPADQMERGESIVHLASDPTRVDIVEGGKTRFHSVQNGLRRVGTDAIVFVHDGARCLISTDLITRCYEAAIEFGSAVPVIGPADSVRILHHSSHQPLDRSQIKLVQTPQTFQSSVLQSAYLQPYQDIFTDEATVVEASGYSVHLIEGDALNLKITTPLDLIVAEHLLIERYRSAHPSNGPGERTLFEK